MSEDYQKFKDVNSVETKIKKLLIVILAGLALTAITRPKLWEQLSYQSFLADWVLYLMVLYFGLSILVITMSLLTRQTIKRKLMYAIIVPAFILILINIIGAVYVFFLGSINPLLLFYL